MTVNLGIGLAIALVLLLVVSIIADRLAGLGLEKEQGIAAVRAFAQLGVVSLVITAATKVLWGSFLFALLMFGVAVWTTAKRVGAKKAWPWMALSMLLGIIPVELIIFLTGAAPFNGVAVIALCGIIIGNAMTANTLIGRRAFAALRDNQGTYEAMLSLGFQRPDGIKLILEPVAADAIVPNLDTTKTVGLVTLPGAFIGVLLGGGSPLQAGAAQLLVLLGIMCCQTIVVWVDTRLMAAGRLLPEDLVAQLHE